MAPWLQSLVANNMHAGITHMQQSVWVYELSCVTGVARRKAKPPEIARSLNFTFLRSNLANVHADSGQPVSH